MELHHTEQWPLKLHFSIINELVGKLQYFKIWMLVQKRYKFWIMDTSHTSLTRRHRGSKQTPQLQGGHPGSVTPDLMWNMVTVSLSVLTHGAERWAEKYFYWTLWRHSEVDLWPPNSSHNFLSWHHEISCLWKWTDRQTKNMMLEQRHKETNAITITNTINNNTKHSLSDMTLSALCSKLSWASTQTLFSQISCIFSVCFYNFYVFLEIQFTLKPDWCGKTPCRDHEVLFLIICSLINAVNSHVRCVKNTLHRSTESLESSSLFLRRSMVGFTDSTYRQILVSVVKKLYCSHPCSHLSPLLLSWCMELLPWLTPGQEYLHTRLGSSFGYSWCSSNQAEDCLSEKVYFTRILQTCNWAMKF